jgi:thioredoxin reductase
MPFLLSQVHIATSVPGVLGAGDVADRRCRQALIAARKGANAALDADTYLSGRE